MLRDVEEGWRGDRNDNLRDSCIAMADLTEDETSPRHDASDQQLHLEWERCRIDYENEVERRERMQRYRHCSLEEASDVELWLEMHSPHGVNSDSFDVFP